MASTTAPAKTQPLHNFALPHLKWKNNHPRGRSSVSAAATSSSSPNHHSRSSPSQSPMREHPPRQSPLRGAGGDAVPEHRRYPRDSARNGADHNRVVDKSGKRSSYEADQVDGIFTRSSRTDGATTSHSNKESRSRFLIKITAGAVPPPRKEEVEEEEEVEAIEKTWNLRPRKPIGKSLNASGVGGNNGSEKRGNFNGGSRSRVVDSGAGGDMDESPEKLKRVRFSIPLSKEEIEEDIFAINGFKPARRPKKRPKILQKQLDTLFPGLWLASITPDSYRVSENPLKG